uniref:Uncharacterized protein n=1 Tax=Oryza nivara TaxID=4536 RepID=A0A0E0HSZ0_ORYNI
MAPVVVSTTRPPAAVGGDGDPPPMKPPTAVGDPDPAAAPPPPPAAPGFSIELTIRAVVCPLSPSSESKSPSVAPLDNNGSRHGVGDSNENHITPPPPPPPPRLGTLSSIEPTPTHDPVDSSEQHKTPPPHPRRGARSSVDPTPTNDPTPDPGNPSPSPCRVALQGDRSKL